MTTVTPIFTDITLLNVDAIVNAANEDMRGGGGVDFAIHKGAGPELVKETVKHAPLYVSKVAVTSGYNLKAKNIIHTVGPKYHYGHSGEYIALEMCYRNVISTADAMGAKNIAIPAISAGVFGFPPERAAKIAVETSISEANGLALQNLDNILLVAYDKETYELYQDLLEQRT